ncbi:hypothetical protein SRABI106_02948 [Rahnella aquatilis]|nr:hypothetical protein SRABI106_02948 [Rahnella aquatilis]
MDIMSADDEKIAFMNKFSLVVDYMKPAAVADNNQLIKLMPVYIFHRLAIHIE